MINRSSVRSTIYKYRSISKSQILLRYEMEKMGILKNHPVGRPTINHQQGHQGWEPQNLKSGAVGGSRNCNHIHHHTRDHTPRTGSQEVAHNVADNVLHEIGLGPGCTFLVVAGNELAPAHTGPVVHGSSRRAAAVSHPRSKRD